MDGYPQQAYYSQDPVRTDISRRVDALDRDYRQLSIGEIARRADDLRHYGFSHGFQAVGRLAGALGDAISRYGRAAMIPLYLQSLREAASSDPADPRTTELLLAAVSVRLAS